MQRPQLRISNNLKIKIPPNTCWKIQLILCQSSGLQILQNYQWNTIRETLEDVRVVLNHRPCYKDIIQIQIRARKELMNSLEKISANSYTSCRREDPKVIKYRRNSAFTFVAKLFTIRQMSREQSFWAWKGAVVRAVRLNYFTVLGYARLTYSKTLLHGLVRERLQISLQIWSTYKRIN